MSTTIESLKIDESIDSPSVTASDRARRLIREDILAGRLPLGHRITASRLSERYAIGLVPIREALLHLESEGLLESSAHRGAVVRNVDAKLVYDVYEIRRALGCLLVRNAAKKILAHELARVRQCQLLYEAAAEEGNSLEMLRANSQFHGAIHAAGDNPEASKIVDRGWDLVTTLRHRHGYGQDRVAQIIVDHRELVAALENHDEKRAEAIMDAHCRAARDDLLEQFA